MKKLISLTSVLLCAIMLCACAPKEFGTILNNNVHNLFVIVQI